MRSSTSRRILFEMNNAEETNNRSCNSEILCNKKIFEKLWHFNEKILQYNCTFSFQKFFQIIRRNTTSIISHRRFLRFVRINVRWKPTPKFSLIFFRIWRKKPWPTNANGEKKHLEKLKRNMYAKRWTVEKTNLWMLKSQDLVQSWKYPSADNWTESQESRRPIIVVQLNFAYTTVFFTRWNFKE